MTFGLAFSALGQSNGGRMSDQIVNVSIHTKFLLDLGDAGDVLMGCVHTLIAAGLYGGNYGK